MLLRPRQEIFSDRCNEALAERGNTLGVAPTGSGKTVMGAHAVGRQRPQAALIIQHRDELVTQNRTTFELVNPGLSTGLYTADRKEWGYNATFAMIQTLVRNLDKMPPIDVMFIDEGHHAAADSYLKTIDRAYTINPDMKLLLLTATPNRGDKKALRSVVSNCADQIFLKEMIDAGFLVPPRTFVIDIGVRQELAGVRKMLNDFDMNAVEAIMDKQVLNDEVVRHWKERAGDRQTVVFCPTVAHAAHIRDAFQAAGVRAALVDGDMSSRDRRATLAAYEREEFQVITNCMVLTEGWDDQKTSCVILLRPSSYKSTLIQMIGRGLRKVDPERYPGRRKDDCIVLDFGTSILMHGGIEQQVNLDAKGVKDCPGCNATLPAQASECPICGHEFPQEEEAATKTCKECDAENPRNARVCVECGAPFTEQVEREDLGNFVMTEVDLLRDSPFKWEPLFDGLVMVATAFDAWAMVIAYYGRWFALGSSGDTGLRLIGDNEDRLLSLASADDFLREHGDTDAGNKSKSWLRQPPSRKQLEMLGMVPKGGDPWAPVDPLLMGGLTRYQAACHITWRLNERAVRKKLEMTGRMVA